MFRYLSLQTRSLRRGLYFNLGLLFLEQGEFAEALQPLGTAITVKARSGRWLFSAERMPAWIG
jgi:hypothetical protein